jgi:glycosyltransferase involved in cell wall biosynthesis
MASTSPLRVLFLIGYLSDKGGAERFALGLATHVPRDRIEPYVCFTRSAAEEPLRELRAAGIRFRGLGRRRRWDLYRMAGLAHLIRRERFDVIHAHMFGSNVWGAVLGRTLRVPVVIAHEHTWAYRGNPVRAWIDGRVIGRLATRFVAVSPHDAERMVNYERVPPDKVLVMPTAYIASANATGSDIRAELGIEAGAPVIVTAAVLRPQKALEVLLDAYSLLRDRLPDAHLVIAGDGECRARLERRAQDLQVDGHVHFLGVRHDVDAILGVADVAALSSDFEGMPLFTFECMANRTPLVATAVGGLPSVIEHGSTGMLVPPRDPDALAQALVELLADPRARTRMADAAAELLPRFTIDTVAEQFAAMYEHLTADVARRPARGGG